jgi:LPS export ABC transporter protein LptC
MLRKATFAVSILAIIGILIWLPAHRRPTKPEPRPSFRNPRQDSGQLRAIGQKLGDLLAEGSSFRQTDKQGRPLFEVTGERIRNRPENEELHVSKAKATVYEVGKPAFVFDANEITVRYGKGRERVVFLGQVRIDSKSDHARLFAGQVHYNPSTKRILARDGIRFERSDLFAECTQLVADTALRTITFKGPIQGRIITRHGL